MSRRKPVAFGLAIAIALALVVACSPSPQAPPSSSASATAAPVVAAPRVVPTIPPAPVHSHPYATRDGRSIRIGNEFMEVVFATDRGGIESIVDKTSGVDLRPKKDVQPSVWQIWLVDPDGTRVGGGEWSADTFTASVTSTAELAAVEFHWTGLRTYDGLHRIPGLSVTATVTAPSDESGTLWRIRVEQPGQFAVVDVDYPFITGIGALSANGSDDRLFWPKQEGRLFANPTATVTSLGGMYPSAQSSMQFLAYYNSSAGFFIGTRDTKGQTKSYNWTNPAPGEFSLIISHSFALPPGTAASVDYDVVISTFHGDAYTAADMYKEWAYQQWWVAEAQAKKTPVWLRNLGLGMQFCAYGCGPMKDKTLHELQLQVAEQDRFFHLPTLVSIAGWERGGAWRSGDYFPPHEGWTAFDQTVRAIHNAGDRVDAYINFCCLATSSEPWQSGDARPYAATQRDGSPLIVPSGVDYVQWVGMDPSTAYWQGQLVTAARTLAEHGVDVIQLDGLPEQEPMDDFSAGHPPGQGGDWQTQARLAVVQAVRSAVRAVRPDVALSGENINELYLPHFDRFTTRDNWAEFDDSIMATQGGEPIPLFDYVYAPYVVIENNDDFLLDVRPGEIGYNLLRLSRSLLWGHYENYFLLWPDALSGPDTDLSALAYLRGIAVARTSYAKPFLVEGAMLHPPPVSTPTTHVVAPRPNWRAAPPYIDIVRDVSAVQASAWRSPDNEVGIVLTNIADSSVGFSVSLDLAQLGLLEGDHYVVRFVTDRGTRELATDLTTSRSIDLQLPAGGVALVTLSAAAR
jgi:hypothetical protein